jgi:hypothetical protein
MRKTRFPVAALVVAAAFVACDSPTGPGNHRAVQRISLEQTVADEVAPDDTSRRYSFVSSDSGLYGVYVQLLEGRATLLVQDSATHAIRTAISLLPSTGPLHAQATAPFILPRGATTVIEIRALPFGSTAPFRLQPHRIDTRPEHQLLGNQFAIGDTIATESLDDILDVDEFTTTGTAGQEIAAAIKATGSTGTEGITLTVFDPNHFFTTYTFTSAGEPGAVTGRFALPTSGTYRFRVQSILGLQGRYTGPFTFWSYRIKRAPEHVSAALVENTISGGEDLAPPGDVDEFTFYPTAGTEYNVFLQSKRPALVRLQAFDAGGNYLAFVDAVPADTGMFEHATGRFSSPTPMMTMRVFGEEDHAVTDTGAYRLFLYRVNPLPEHVPATMAPGDTVSGESIDVPGDVDEFTFSGTAGEEMNLAFQALPTSDVLRVDVVNPSGQSVAYAETFVAGTSLYQQLTGLFTLPVTGAYRVRVTGSNSRYGYDVGPYRFFLYRVSRQPESVPATLSLGDSVSGESIGLPGDVDEFRVTVPDSGGANLVLELESIAGGGVLSGLVLDSATGVGIAGIETAVTGPRVGSGRMQLAAGTHIVRVTGSPYFRGSYRLWLYAFALTPETVPASFAIGDTVAGESIEPWGDADFFRFHGNAGDRVNLLFQGMSQSSSELFEAWLTTPGAPGSYPAAILYSPTSTAMLGDYQTSRLDLPVTGWYDLRVSGSNSIDGRGAYRFALLREDSMPEHVPASLMPGDSIGTELIDRPGDFDQFRLAGTPGDALEIFFDGRTASAPFAYVRASDASTGDSLAGTVGQFARIVGPFLIPASGQVNIAVLEPAGFYRTCYTSCNVYYFTGLYGLKVVSVDLGPESGPATYVIGDTVRGEAIAPVGDVDQFTASATPGDQLSPFFRLTAPTTIDNAMALEIIDPATGSVLWGYGAAYFGTIYGTSGTPFTVPASGSFTIRIRSYRSFEELGFGTSGYEFFIKR